MFHSCLFGSAHNKYSVETSLNRTRLSFAYDAFVGLLPQSLVTIAHRAPTKRFRRWQSYMKTAREVAQTLVDRQVTSHVEVKDGFKDVMSILSNPLPLTRSSYTTHCYFS
jgi:hypothetical protein